MGWEHCFDVSDGVARRRDLYVAGLSRDRLATALNRGRWQMPLPGVVVCQSGPLSGRQRWRAAVAFGGPGAVLSHESAGVLHGLRVVERRVHITVPHGRHLRSAGFVIVHQTTRAAEGERLGRIPCTSAARTVVDIAVSLRRRDDVRALVSDSVQRRIVSVADLLLAAESCQRRGRRFLGDALEGVVAGTRSAGEALFRDLLRRADIAEPEWNAAVVTATGKYLVDALWRAARLGVEIDGARWHLDALAWERDLRRANALQAAGLRLLRFSVRQLMYEPAAVVDAVRAALSNAPAA